MKRLVGLTTLLLLLLAVAMPATATQCEVFINHSGFVPDGWTATFTEDNIDYGPYVGPAYVDPGTAYEGNRTWDRAVKCRTVENTTTTSSSIPPSSTTTIPTITTTTQNPTTSTSTTLSGTSTSSTQPPTSTSTPPSAPSSTVPTPSTTDPSNPELAELPFTGVEDVWPLAGLLLLVAGVGVLTVTRREDES